MSTNDDYIIITDKSIRSLNDAFEYSKRLAIKQITPSDLLKEYVVKITDDMYYKVTVDVMVERFNNGNCRPICSKVVKYEKWSDKK